MFGEMGVRGLPLACGGGVFAGVEGMTVASLKSGNWIVRRKVITEGEEGRNGMVVWGWEIWLQSREIV